VTETPSDYFTQLWSRSPDPWDHAGRWYEHRKYDVTAAALPAQRYRHILEPACGIGLLTTRLAARADRVTATDRFPEAVAETRQRCRELANVTTGLGDVRDGPPPGAYDAVVLSEVLYYFDEATVIDTLRRWLDASVAGGHILLTHYRPGVADHVLTGDDVHGIAADVLGESDVALVDPHFLIDVFRVR
jgi:SAM-dependent methyltransferase